jgi:hypothetical protein
LFSEPAKEATVIRGSYLCGGVRFEITGKVSGIGQCHCSLCRKASGTASNAVILTSRRSFNWVQGEELAQEWDSPSGRGNSFCRVCGSPLPAYHPSGKLLWVPAGLLDDDPGTRVEQQIFVASKAPWDEIPEGVPQYEEAAPPRS